MSGALRLIGWCIGGAITLTQAAPDKTPSSALSSRALVEVGDLSNPRISPSGREVVVRLARQDVPSNKTRLEWHVVSLNGRASNTFLTDAGEPAWGTNGNLLGEEAMWDPTSKWIYYRAIHDQQVQVWRIAADGSHREQLTTHPGNVERFELSRNGEEVQFVVRHTREEVQQAEQREYDAGTLLDESVEPFFPIARTLPIDGRMATARRVGPGRLGPLLASAEEHSFKLNLKTRAVSSATTHEPSSTHFRGGGQGIVGAEVESDGGKAYVAYHSRASGRRLAITVDVRGRTRECKHTVCEARPGQLRLLGWYRGAVFFTNEELQSQSLNLWDVERDSVRTVMQTTGVIGGDRHGSGACSIARDELVCIFSDAGTPPRLVAISIQTGEVRILFDPNARGLSAAHLGQSIRMPIQDKRGNLAMGFLILPPDYKSRGRMPLVITSYSCVGFLRGGSGDDVPEHLLASLGIASFCLDFSLNRRRLAVEAEPSLSAREIPEEVQLGDAFLSLCLALVDELDRQGLVDPRKVALTGMSGSASLTLYAISQSRAFAAAHISTQGYDDPSATYLLGAATDNFRRRVEAGKARFPYLDPAWWRQFSPALNAKSIRTPLLMQLPDREFLGAMELYSNLKDVDGPVEMVIYPDEFHIKTQPRHRVAQYERAIDWIRYWLQGAVDSSASKAIQYVRWNRMRNSIP